MGTIAQLDVNLGMNVGGFVTSAGKAKGAMTDLGAIADRVFRDTRSAAETFQERLAQLGGLYSRGQIDAETYGRAVRKLRDEMSGAAQKAADFARNAAAQQREAMAAAARQAAQLSDAMARGGQVTRSVMTPVEAYAHRIEELAVLLRQGAISQETFTRAEARAIGQMRAASAAAAGSRQASFGGMFKTLAGGVTAGFLAAQAVREL
ncbi:MAG TPA: SHOCT domain-containing protein, partial [Pirellulales bacterium]|nr:SHOCT domain-containing protein [Pirellulales bacterium]